MAAPTEETVARKGDQIDRLITIDFPRRGVIDLLYGAARAHHGGSLTLAAARLLHTRLSPGRVALIATGWLDRPHVSRYIAETDGPPGAAALARALHFGLGAVPLVLTEEEIVPAVTAAVQAAGLRCVEPEQAVAASASASPLHAAAVVAFPTGTVAAEAMARQLLERYDVGAFAAVEKGGRNREGRVHTSRGHDTTDVLANIDAVLAACTERGVATIGVGDGGNEIGMGTIADRLRGRLRFADDCECGCGGGVVPGRATDVVVAATVSNWGAYGIAAALAVLLEQPDLLHTPQLEEDVLRACAQAGLIDGVSGRVAPSADGLELPVHKALVTLLRAVTGVGVNSAAWT
ncbi:DUF4392 domain-containing protein [Jatrophihabitans cynanchi]|uniref:DUF4392 domain-containing protein n=1 Tax=Jatrophihabitans cynanchi TaxID=2944128 RepID=A0ABY7JRG8_9ACTN|nr:glutamate cyclase domain-containing protein [Jatrophihabitans sp. SB3-54]WAX55151.1 DUF4392 domain-containing protein [Jatrophihabitans sp. SB3-54]